MVVDEILNEEMAECLSNRIPFRKSHDRARQSIISDLLLNTHIYINRVSSRFTTPFVLFFL